jgi:DnaJ-class molecular chaperone
MDYYSILGVNRSASADEIKSAYRKLAMKYHPDRGGDAKKFQEINEAYEILSDSSKKAMYDHGGARGFKQGFQSDPFSDMFSSGRNPFEDLFDQFGFRFNTGSRRQQNSDLTIRVKISLKDSYIGKTMSINYPLPSGKDQTLEITIPPGVENGQTMRMSGMGDDSIKEIQRGDLIIHLEVERDPQFRREEMALVTTLKIDVFDAMLGCDRIVKNIDGTEISLTIRPGTQNGQKYSCKGLGFRSVKFTNVSGDLLVQIIVDTPAIKDKNLAAKVRDLANEIRNKS